jgi:hypothetical protein
MENENVRNNNDSSSLSNVDFKHIVIALGTALVIGLISTVVLQGKKVAAMEERINSTSETLRTNIAVSENKKAVLEKAIAEVVSPEKQLIATIENYQARYIQKSTGTEEYNSVTSEDLARFYDRKTPKKIKDRLSEDTEFLGLVLALKELSPQSWGKIKSSALDVYKPTYSEVGGAQPDGSAQTEAGQEAEKLVSETIVDLASKLKRKDKTEIIEMID